MLDKIINLDFYSFSAIMLYVFFGLLIIQLVYYWVMFGKLAFYKPKASEVFTPPVSVVVCAHNEFQNIQEFIPKLLEQDYPNYEVVLVNDSSDDDTEFLLIDIKIQYPHFRVVKTDRSVTFMRGKKFPLSVGIKMAMNPIIILSDADCYPNSNQWIRQMVNGYQKKESEFVLGYGKYESRKGMLNKLIRFDTVHTATQYFSAAIAGRPYMGVGRNLSYTKDVFIRNKGLVSQYNIPYGDDDLFVNKHARKKNTSIIITPDSFTVSLPPESYKSWFKQKKRHIAAGSLYRFSSKIRTGLYASSAFFFYLLFAIALYLFRNDYFWLAVITSVFLVRMLTQLIIYRKVLTKLQEKGVWGFVPLFDMLFSILNPLWMFSNIIIKKNQWK